MSQEKSVLRIVSFAFLLATLSLVRANAQVSLSCTLPANAQVGVAYTGAGCSASGGSGPYTYSVSPGVLPANLAIDPSTGVITGTPTTAGTYSFTLKAVDNSSTPQSATQAVTNFIVAPAALTLTCTLPAGAQVGVVYSGASCAASGGTTPFTYSVATGSSLPAGLSINSSTGAVTGMPTAAGTYSFTLKAVDSSSTPQSATQAVTNFIVAPAALTLTCTLPAGAQVGVVYSGASCSASGGTTPFTYSLASGSSLPAGLSINSSTGVISGTPTAAGTFSFTLKAVDSSATPQSATQAVTSFVVAPATLTLTCNLPTGAQVGVGYNSANCTAAGGATPYTYSLATGSSLPPGLTMSASTGIFSGTPTAASTYSFTVKVVDSSTTPQTATQAVTNFIVAPAALTLTCNLPAGAQVGVAYNGALCFGGGGTAPYTYSIASGSSLPAGLSINSSTGSVSGTPTTAGTYSFTLKVDDSSATPQSATAATTNFVVFPPTLSINCTLPATAQVGVAYTGAICIATGGTGAYSFSISVGTLPPGLSINSSTGAISGVPTTAGSTSFTVKVLDAGTPQQSATQAVTNFVVAPATLTLTCNLPTGAQVGIGYNSANCTAAGGTTPYTYSLANGTSLPPGINISSSTGIISGTPTTGGTYSFTIKVADSGSQTATQVINNFNVAALLTLTCTAPTSAVIGSSYSANCNAGGGTPPIAYSVVGTLPSGLSLNTTTGALSGTLTTAGTSSFSIKATDSSTPVQTVSQAISLTVVPVLSITTTTLSNGIVNISYSASCSATGGVTPYSFAISAGALPTGLSLNSTNCAITGTPTASGTFNFSIKATDTESTPQAATQPLSITVNPALGITSTTAPNGSVGLAYAFNLTAQNGSGSYTWSLVSGSLPPGLNFNSSGLISGTPTTAGSFTFAMKVTDSGSPQQSQTQTFSNVSIAAGLTITTTSLPSGIVGTSYTAPLAAQNGVAPYTWSISSGSLPGGLSISGSSITGTPTASGTFTVVARVTDSTTPTAQVATQSLSVTIESVLSLSQTTFPGGIIGLAYSASCSASGGTGTYSYAISAGSLPAGLSLNAANCTVSGTPSGTAGTANFTVKVTDAGPPAQSATRAYSITTSQGLAITTSSVPSGNVGTAYSFSLIAQNGSTPYGWALTSGALPPGLTLNGSGGITGTPTAVGTYSFTVRVTDSSNQSASQTFSLVINPAAISANCFYATSAQVGVFYGGGGCSTSGGTAPYVYSISSGTLPAGLTLNTSTSVISGTPTAAGTYAFTVLVTDSGTPRQTFSYPVTNFVVQPASAPQVPTFSLVGFPTSQGPGIGITGESISLSTSSAAWPVTVSLGFTPNATGVSSGYIDPALQFVSSGCAAPCTSYQVTIPALTNSVTLPQIAPGTVEGRISVTLTVNGQNGANTSVSVPASIPFISPGSVQVTNITSSGFDVEVIANSSPRDLKSATYTFNSSGGAVINGTTTFTVDVSTFLASWYNSATSQQYGSLFMLTIPFTFSGSSSAIGSVTVTLTNSVGTSAPATGAF